eukprot:scaffold16186_cov70-Isochrysis_galbana.AAC.1
MSRTESPTHPLPTRDAHFTLRLGHRRQDHRAPTLLVGQAPQPLPKPTHRPVTQVHLTDVTATHAGVNQAGVNGAWPGRTGRPPSGIARLGGQSDSCPPQLRRRRLTLPLPHRLRRIVSRPLCQLPQPR